MTFSFAGEPPAVTCPTESCASDVFNPGYSSPGINLSLNIFDPDGVTLSDTLNMVSRPALTKSPLSLTQTSKERR